MTIGAQMVDIFPKGDNDGSFQEITTPLDDAPQDVKGDPSLDIKTRWEAEGNLMITVEDLDRFCRQQCLTTSSSSWGNTAGRTWLDSFAPQHRN